MEIEKRAVWFLDQAGSFNDGVVYEVDNEVDETRKDERERVGGIGSIIVREDWTPKEQRAYGYNIIRAKYNLGSVFPLFPPWGCMWL